MLWRRPQKQLGAARESAMTALESEASEKSTFVPGATARGAARRCKRSRQRRWRRRFRPAWKACWKLWRAKIHETQQQSVEETQKQLSAARESAVTALESEATEKSASYGEQLRAALVEMQAQQTKEMESAIQTSLEGLARRAARKDSRGPKAVAWRRPP